MKRVEYNDDYTELRATQKKMNRLIKQERYDEAAQLKPTLDKLLEERRIQREEDERKSLDESKVYYKKYYKLYYKIKWLDENNLDATEYEKEFEELRKGRKHKTRKPKITNEEKLENKRKIDESINKKKTHYEKEINRIIWLYKTNQMIDFDYYLLSHYFLEFFEFNKNDDSYPVKRQIKIMIEKLEELFNS